MKTRISAAIGLLLTGLVVAALTAATLAHDGATGIVKERMDAMSAIGKAMKSIAAITKGDTEFDAQAISAATGIIEKHSGGNLTRLFPQGSSGGGSEAMPDIWQNWHEFETLADELNSQATSLARGLQKPTPAEFGKLAATCRDCHEKFRIKKQ